MKSMRKIISSILAAALALAITVPAAATDARLSRQKLQVDGEPAECRMYNIGGSNYVRLRDLASLLSGTGSAFDVDWDNATETVSITTGQDYAGSVGEPETAGDGPADAQASAYSVVIDGKSAEGISFYSIGGSDYFRLRDLGEALGFDVGYDEGSDTAIVRSRPRDRDSSDSFDAALAAYLEANGYADSGYVVSPASLRAALCLAIAGADGDTLDGLLRAADFGSMDDAEAWLGDLNASVAQFAEELERLGKYADDDGDSLLFSFRPPDRTFLLANAVWSNTDVSGGFLDDYVRYVEDSLGATASESPAARITDDVNAWCGEMTGGMIPAIAGDLGGCASVLANALYLKSAWSSGFYESLTKEDVFHAADGGEIMLDFMEQTDRFKYCDDGDSSYAVFPLEGGKSFMVRLNPEGETGCDVGAFPDAIGDLKPAMLHVRMPKLDLDASFDRGELLGFLSARGAELAFDPEGADFSKMAGGSPWYVGNIIQKAKLKTDEEGLEAAAATVFEQVPTSSIGFDEPEPIIQFILDRPFSFVILDGLREDSAVLFAGQFTGM